MPDEQITFYEALDQLRGAFERELIYYKVMVSTLEGGAGQQSRLMKEKDYYIDELETELYELKFNVKELKDELNKAPEPYPYTNPIRDLPEYSKRRLANA